MFLIPCDIVFAFAVSGVFSCVLYLLQSVCPITEEVVFHRTNIVYVSVLKIESGCVFLVSFFF